MKTKIILCLCLFSLCIFPLEAQDEVADLLARINGLRRQLDLHTYKLNNKLTIAAQNHADWMVDTGEVTHIQFDGSTPADRARALGYNSPWVSENIYMGGLANANYAWQFWINSSVHYDGLTSPNFSDIGIATAEGLHGQAYVLVFGADGAIQPSVTTGGGQTGSGRTGRGQIGGGQQSNDNPVNEAPETAPEYVVGVDENGNIMHQIGAGDTLGQILLNYGYTWEDMSTIMLLNDLTNADIDTLEVGQIILIPPMAGTYTPAPDDGGIIPTPVAASPTDRLDNEARIEATATNILLPRATFIPPDNDDDTPRTPRPTNTPRPIPTAIPPPTITPELVLPSATSQQVLLLSTDIAPSSASPIPTESDILIEDDSGSVSGNRAPIWLISAIVLQVGILGFASLEFWRRNRK